MTVVTEIAYISQQNILFIISTISKTIRVDRKRNERKKKNKPKTSTFAQVERPIEWNVYFFLVVFEFAVDFCVLFFRALLLFSCKFFWFLFRSFLCFEFFIHYVYVIAAAVAIAVVVAASEICACVLFPKNVSSILVIFNMFILRIY